MSQSPVFSVPSVVCLVVAIVGIWAPNGKGHYQLM